MQGPAATVWVPGTCGELVQGVRAGRPFLVSCPIAVGARVTATLRRDCRIAGPPDRPRARQAVQATLAYLGRSDLGVDIAIENPLPVRRGFGSSTADIAGAIAATAIAAGVAELEPVEIARIAVGIEPTDSTMFPGLAIFDHRDGTDWELLGQPPDAAIVVLDFGGGVDTITYNARLDLSAWTRRAADHEEALALLRAGVREGDLGLIGAAATRSALAHQTILSKPALPIVLDLAERYGTYGVCAAHSGTALGVLISCQRGPIAGLLAAARKKIPGLVAAWSTRLVSGGIRVESSPTSLKRSALSPAGLS